LGKEEEKNLKKGENLPYALGLSQTNVSIHSKESSTLSWIKVNYDDFGGKKINRKRGGKTGRGGEGKRKPVS